MAVHSNEKLRVFASEAFRSEKSTETFNYSTEPRNNRVNLKKPEVSFLLKIINFIRNFVFFNGIFRVLFNYDMSSNII
jgi:hypothetical protein